MSGQGNSPRFDAFSTSLLERVRIQTPLVEVPCNSTRILERWDLLKKLKVSAVQAAAVKWRSYRNKSILYEQKLMPSLEDVYGTPLLLVNRSDFLTVLVDKARRLGVSIHLGTAISEIEFDKTMIHTASNAYHTFDAIICADGLKSTCRSLFAERLSPPIPTGHLAYRITIPTNILSRFPDLQALAQEQNLESWIGPDAHGIKYKLKGGDLFNLVFVTDDDLPENFAVTSVPSGDIERHLQGWDPRLGRLFALAPGEILEWEICVSPTPASWVHSSGTVALLGDAAHASLPCLGQGAASAVEDAAVLGALFSRITHPTNPQQVHSLLLDYEKIRRPRVKRLVEGAAQMRDFNHLADGPEEEARDAELRHGKEKGRGKVGWGNVYADPEFQKWMLGIDVMGEVEAMLKGEEGVLKAEGWW